MPFVQVLVNGKSPFTFGIDTETGTEALVSPAHAWPFCVSLRRHRGVGAERASHAAAPAGPAGHRVGRWRRLPRRRGRGDQPSQAEGRCDGILGFTLFRDRLVRLDYPGAPERERWPTRSRE